MNVRTHLIALVTIVSLISFAAPPAFAEIEIPRAIELMFSWAPAPGPVDYYNVYLYCNDGNGMLRGTAFEPVKGIPVPNFCEELVVRVAACCSRTDGSEGPLSAPSELIRFVTEGGETVSDNTNPSDEPPLDASSGAGVLLDFDGDRKSDILIQNAHTGQLQLWGLEKGKAVFISSLPSLAAEAWVVGNGDMNADGNADLLYLNRDTGELGVWLIAGGAVIGGGAIDDIALDWEVVGNSDHDGDGRADVLLHHRATGDLHLWTMSGTEIQEVGPLSHFHGPGWKVAATGDYDGDGRADLLWHNPDAGQIDIWLMNERTLVADAAISVGLEPSWSIVAAGDFDLDGRSDIVWRSEATGEMRIWFLEAEGLRSQIVLDAKARVPARVVGSADYDGDGFLDLLIQLGGPRGSLRGLFMNGGEILDNVRIGEKSFPWFVVSVGELSPLQ